MVGQVGQVGHFGGIERWLSQNGSRHVTMHNLIGDVLIEQPNAYEKIALKVS